jgi:hypothetical protein
VGGRSSLPLFEADSVPSNPCDLLEFREAALVTVEPGRGATSGLLENPGAPFVIVVSPTHGFLLAVAALATQLLQRALPPKRIR